MSAPGPDLRSGSDSTSGSLADSVPAADAPSPEVVVKCAELARLALSPAELARLAPEITRILTTFASLARCPAAPPAMRAASSATGRERADEPRASLARASVLAAAPEPEDGFFAVPKTVGGAP